MFLGFWLTEEITLRFAVLPRINEWTWQSGTLFSVHSFGRLGLSETDSFHVRRPFWWQRICRLSLRNKPRVLHACKACNDLGIRLESRISFVLVWDVIGTVKWRQFGLWKESEMELGRRPKD